MSLNCWGQGPIMGRGCRPVNIGPSSWQGSSCHTATSAGGAQTVWQQDKQLEGLALHKVMPTLTKNTGPTHTCAHNRPPPSAGEGGELMQGGSAVGG